MRDIRSYFKIRSHCTEDASPSVILAHTPRVFTSRLVSAMERLYACGYRCREGVGLTRLVRDVPPAVHFFMPNREHFMGNERVPNAMQPHYYRIPTRTAEEMLRSSLLDCLTDAPQNSHHMS